MTGAVVSEPSVSRTRQPLRCNDSSVAPRASAVVSTPERLSQAPSRPPIAPAPTTHTLVVRLGTGAT
ncbi:hypothetical protein GCM10025868_20610 [Angustibacter aerolatus]|uniref:Uncharacterized protein n=1 Tax=Angustibacter aerolatus TaxID=1162965 RepID=A0ABQ6JJ38_9ACTN|nr:hypothetical protein GCM10025868_20610 [Angustibacter aerolatus]